MKSVKMDELDGLTWKLVRTQDLATISRILYEQGYNVVLNRIDEEQRDFIVSVFHMDIDSDTVGHPVVVDTSLDGLEYHLRIGDLDTGLKLLRAVIPAGGKAPSDMERQTERPDGVILFSEIQRHAGNTTRDVYIYFDESESEYPVIMRVGQEEYGFCSLTDAMFDYRRNFGSLDIDPERLRQDMKEARRRYRVCMNAWRKNHADTHR